MKFNKFSIKKNLKVRFHQHYYSLAEKIAVWKCLSSPWLSTGPLTEQFEKEIMKKIGVHFCLSTNSATAGLFLAMKHFGVKHGDEVITTPFSFTATAAAIFMCGAKPVFVDIDRDYNLNPKHLKSALSSKTKVILSVDYGGLPCRYDEIYQIIHSEKHLFKADNDYQRELGRCLVLADASHSFGASQTVDDKNIKVGHLADMTVFSFHVAKNLSCVDGGAILAQSFLSEKKLQTLFETMRRSSLHGMDKTAFERANGQSWKYDVIDYGYKFNLNDINSALGLVQLRKQKKIRKKKLSIVKSYLKAFKDHPYFQVWEFQGEWANHGLHLFPLMVKNENKKLRDEILKKLQLAGVQLNVHYRPIVDLSFYKSQGYQLKDYSICRDISERIFSLPLYYQLSKKQIKYIIEQINLVVT